MADRWQVCVVGMRGQRFTLPVRSTTPMDELVSLVQHALKLEATPKLVHEGLMLDISGCVAPRLTRENSVIHVLE